jgi:hypothetical protein
MTTRSTRAVRGAAAAVIATWTAAVSHTIGGGHAPSLLLILVVAALALPFAVALAGRRSSPSRLALIVGGAQVLFHFAFASTAHLSGARTGHVHVRTAPPAGGRAASFVPEWDMFVAHVVAAILTFIVLAYGERLILAVARGIARLVVLPADVALPLPSRAGRAIEARPGAARRLSLTSNFSRRGPPALVVAA